MMYQKKLEEDIRCPLEYGLELFGGKWKSRIICVLAAKQVLRYSEIRKEMVNITDAVLASTLKELLVSQIICRKSYDEIPPRVEYSLTEKGQFCRVFVNGRARFIKRIPRTPCCNAKNVITDERKRHESDCLHRA